MDFNQMSIKFKSLPSNCAFARATIGAFLSQVDPTMEQLHDIKMAVSEAVTNAIIHGYNNHPEGYVHLGCKYQVDENSKVDITISIKDTGKGIEDVAQARTALYTTSESEERAGLGFTVMASVVDKVEVESTVLVGTIVTLHTSLHPPKHYSA